MALLPPALHHAMIVHQAGTKQVHMLKHRPLAPSC